MTDIVELERRLSAAMDRISRAGSARPAAGDSGLRDRLVAAELRLSEAETALLEAKDELARQKRLCAELSEANAALTEAGQGAGTDSGLRDELAALRARRAAERAELETLLKALAPLVGES